MAKILVVDDDDSVRISVARALTSTGHQVDQAADGVEGLERIEQCAADYDLIVSDIRMPEMDGIEMSRIAARRYPNLRIVLITGYADQRERAEDLKKIIFYVMLKPFALADLRSLVSQALAA